MTSGCQKFRDGAWGPGWEDGKCTYIGAQEGDLCGDGSGVYLDRGDANTCDKMIHLHCSNVHFPALI